MKRIIRILMVLCLIVSLAACSTSKSSGDEKTYTGAPVIVINDNEYFADISSIVNDLPDGYEYGGKLTEEQLKYAYLNGTEYYFDKQRENLYDFYVYQEKILRQSTSAVPLQIIKIVRCFPKKHG